MVVKEERAIFWLERGAQPTEAVARILDKTGVLAKTSASVEVPGKAADNA